jgi:S1-C subfamily serine protease
VVGIAFQSLVGEAEGIGYVIPVPVVEHVLGQMARYAAATAAAAAPIAARPTASRRGSAATTSTALVTPGAGASSSSAAAAAAAVCVPAAALRFGRLGFWYQMIENATLKAACRLPPGGSGVMVSKTIPVSSLSGVLQPGDVICAIDGQPIADDGTVVFRGDERISFAHLLTSKYVGEDVALSVVRGGQALTLHAPLEDVPDLVPHTLYDAKPSYLVLCGLVFTALSEPYLYAAFGREWESRAPVRSVYAVFHGIVERPGQQVVFLSAILTNAVTVGYEPEELAGLPVTALNGTPLSNLADLARALAAARRPWRPRARSAAAARPRRRRPPARAPGPPGYSAACR